MPDQPPQECNCGQLPGEVQVTVLQVEVTDSERRRAWDMYVAARLVRILGGTPMDPEDHARYADKMLAERDKRFPPQGVKQ
jgi:hypothetical protein